MVDFKKLKKQAGNLEKLTSEIAKQNSANNYSQNDDTYWKPDLDKAGNGFAEIRFLAEPKVDGDDALPWVKYFDHGFQGPGGWYIEKSLTTLGLKDPVSEYNTVLWNSGKDSDKEIARKQKRRIHYVANILVISDSKHPENEGKDFRYRFGVKIFEKIQSKMTPEFPDEEAFNPFDFWKGANFKLKIRKVEGYINYEKSEFMAPSALFDGNDKKIEELWTRLRSLKEVVSPKNFKTYEELKKRFDRVLGVSGSTIQSGSSEDVPFETDDTKPGPKPSVIVEKTSIDAEGDTDLEYFKNLAEQD